MLQLLLLCIRGYQRVLSPLKPPCCRFSPTCSEYAAEALRTHGVIKGSLLSIWRILRCQPCAKHGHDPVPPAGEWRHREQQLSR